MSLPFPRPERYEVSLRAADTLNERRRAGGRIGVCGTSALRALETVRTTAPAGCPRGPAGPT
ncbi:S-adenosylmethionine:tRNA ribosyltransferase-isomerase [Streptomyces sp. NPDC058678]|uniref:S-adenosylmethionine:tRNA ribosyltransferase-isomerase n=1 Tax=Streptomyces sp. NPDC058678 TaxID=3346595 RepID=UPI0036535977